MTKRPRALLLAAAMLAASSSFAAGPEKGFPNHRVTVIVPIAPGGGGDAVARAIADGMSREIGFPVIVENRPGGNGVLAATAVAASTPDAHTVLLGFSGLVQNAALRTDIKDVLPLLEPVGQLLSTGFAYAVSPELKVDSLGELVQYARSTRTELNYGTNGVGSVQHLDGHIFSKQAGIRMVHVPYKGGEVESLTAVMSGSIQSAFGSPGIFKAFQASGKIKVLAVSGPRRNPSLPEVPTFAELGYANLDMMGWVGAFVSKGTPASDVARLNAVLRAALQGQATRDRIALVGFGVDTTSAADFKRQIGSEIVRWKALGADIKFD